MVLRVENISWWADGRPIIDGVDIYAEPGEFIGVVGPNGSGKSTLLRCIYRVLEPNVGIVTLAGEDVLGLSVREAAQRTAVVLQETISEFDMSVRQVVSLGRTPHKGMFDRETDEDLRIVEESMQRVGVSELAGRSFHTLSGGEKQRVLIARALVQEASLLVLDEPINHLDIRYQLEVLDLVKGLNVTKVAAIHDLNLASGYCDRIYVLAGGRIAARGAPADVLTPDLIRTVFDVESLVDTHPVTGAPRITFCSSGASQKIGTVSAARGQEIPVSAESRCYDSL